MYSFYALDLFSFTHGWNTLLETYRLEDEDDYVDKIWIKVLSHILRKLTSPKASFYLFSTDS